MAKQYDVIEVPINTDTRNNLQKGLNEHAKHGWSVLWMETTTPEAYGSVFVVLEKEVGPDLHNPVARVV